MIQGVVRLPSLSSSFCKMSRGRATQSPRFFVSFDYSAVGIVSETHGFCVITLISL
jgi:hypothetical protein